MEHMECEFTFAKICFSEKGVPGEMAALFRREDADEIKTRLDNIPPFLISETHDPLTLDTVLAAFVEKAFTGIQCIAAAVARPGIDVDLSCGAVIGIPEQDHTSADKRLREAGNGLWYWAYPGVCGFALLGTREEAESCIDKIYSLIREKTEPWYGLEKKLIGKPFLYVSDSEGRNCFTEGILEAGNGEEVRR